MTAEAEFLAKKKYAKSQMERDEALAKFQLDEDLQFFEGNTKHQYKLDQMQRDVLAAHTRQDAAHALITAIRISHEVRILKWLMIAIIAIQLFIILR